MLGAVDFLFGRFFTYRDVLVLSKQRLSKHTVTGFGSVFSICFKGEGLGDLICCLNHYVSGSTIYPWKRSAKYPLAEYHHHLFSCCFERCRFYWRL